MNLLPRLALLLFALALLPGAPVHAHAPAASAIAPHHAGHVPAPIPASLPDADCHEAAGISTADQGGHPAMSLNAADCCTADAGADHACGSACACPSAAPALPLPAAIALAMTPMAHDGARGAPAWIGLAYAPPNRPPID